jgi:hypothetical protein
MVKNQEITDIKKLAADQRRELDRVRRPVPRVSVGRRASEDELILAAWANLALERPEIELEEIKRLCRETNGQR